MESVEERTTKLEKSVQMLVGLVQNTHETLKEIVLKVDENFAKIEERFAKMDERFAKIEDRLTRIENNLNILTKDTSSNFGSVEVKLDSITEELSKINATTGYEEEYKNLKIVTS